MKNILIIGLVVWILFKGQKQAQASTSTSTTTEPATISEYELLHTTVPITGYVETEIPVFANLEQYNAAMGVS
jgi:hypothetical protein